MKKIFIISILFVTAFLFFTGCGDSPASGGTGATDTYALFPESEAPISMTSALSLSDLSDGTWEHRRFSASGNSYDDHTIFLPNYEHEDGYTINSYKFIITTVFTVSNGVASFTSETDTSIYSMDDTNKNRLNTFANSKGYTLSWSGNTVTITLNDPNPDGYWLNDMFSCSGYQAYIKTKNNSGTRYLIKINPCTDIFTEIHYLKKLD